MIKHAVATWRERLKPEYHGVKDLAMEAMQSEIGGLRAALVQCIQQSGKQSEAMNPTWIRALEMEFTDDGSPHTESYRLGWIAGIEACMGRLHEMHRITTGRHNFYQHAAIELAKLKDAK